MPIGIRRDVAMAPSKKLGDAAKAITTVIGLMTIIFTLLAILLPTSLVQPIGALVIGLVFTGIFIWMGRLDWGTALIVWVAVSIGFIIVHLFVSRSATVVGRVVDNSGSPAVGLTLVLTDSSGVDHKAVTDENGAFGIRNIPEGKFSVMACGESLMGGSVPSGWKRIVDPKVGVGDLVHKPSPTVAATSTVVAAVTPDTPTTAPIVRTDTPSPSTPAFTPIASPTYTPTRSTPAPSTPDVIFVTELTFTSGASEAGRQMVTIQADQPGQYAIVLENANPTRSGYWITWDYISLKKDDTLIWEIGEDETPNDYTQEAFSEFCDPKIQEGCTTEFMVDSTRAEDFSKDLNDGEFPVARVNFTLTDQDVNADLTLVLSTLYSTHEGAGHFKMKVTLERVTQP